MAPSTPVTYQEANRRFRRAYWPAILLYAALCLGGAYLIKTSHPPGFVVAAIAAATALPIVAVFWLMRRHLAETDEYMRKLRTDALLSGGMITLSLAVVWSFFELYGVVQDDRYFPAMMFVAPAFFVFYDLSFRLARLRNQEPACES